MPEKTLLKALVEAGAGSRRRVADAIKYGHVTVNRRLAEDFRLPVDTDKDRVAVDGQRVDLAAPPTVCLMLNKPAGVLTTTRDERGRGTVMELLPQEYRSMNLHPVGRLDKDTTGLLLLTNDGELTNRLSHPRYEHDKEYHARVARELAAGEMKQMERGVRLEDGLTRRARLQRETGRPDFTYSLTIHEGKKRQVRRMFEHIGHPVLELKRVRIGGLQLGNLKEGACRPLSQRELQTLREAPPQRRR